MIKSQQRRYDGNMIHDMYLQCAHAFDFQRNLMATKSRLLTTVYTKLLCSAIFKRRSTTPERTSNRSQFNHHHRFNITHKDPT